MRDESSRRRRHEKCLSTAPDQTSKTCAHRRGVLIALTAYVAWSSVVAEVSAGAIDDGQRLFDHETFGGNGRTCRTCHSGHDGTITLEETALMYDIRNPDLQDQASGAIDRHALATVPPTSEQLDAIAAFQQTDNRFISSKALKAFAAGGPAPALPAGVTASEKRGREFFVGTPWTPPSKTGACALLSC